jgi:hypothetical protein
MDVSDQETLSTITSASQTSSKKRNRRKRKVKALDKIDATAPDDPVDSIKTEEADSILKLPGGIAKGSASAVSSLLQTTSNLDPESHSLDDVETSSPPASAAQLENITPTDQIAQSKTSKYFASPASIPSAVASSSTTTEPKSRGQKRQRLNSEGDSMPSVAETSKNALEGKKKRSRTEVPQQEGGEMAENEVRETVKLRKKGKTVPMAAEDQPANGASPEASASTIPEQGTRIVTRHSQVTTTDAKPINTTASQLADRARTMKDREELARLRLDQQTLDERLSANKSRMKALEAELGEVKKEREGLKEQSRKEIGFKDEVSLVVSSRLVGIPAQSADKQALPLMGCTGDQIARSIGG